jgi:hypothetical protein
LIDQYRNKTTTVKNHGKNEAKKIGKPEAPTYNPPKNFLIVHQNDPLQHRRIREILYIFRSKSGSTGGH